MIKTWEGAGRGKTEVWANYVFPTLGSSDKVYFLPSAALLQIYMQASASVIWEIYDHTYNQDTLKGAF